MLCLIEAKNDTRFEGHHEQVKYDHMIAHTHLPIYYNNPSHNLIKIQSSTHPTTQPPLTRPSTPTFTLTFTLYFDLGDSDTLPYRFPRIPTPFPFQSTPQSSFSIYPLPKMTFSLPNHTSYLFPPRSCGH